jgi:hypothetical protein
MLGTYLTKLLHNICSSETRGRHAKEEVQVPILLHFISADRFLDELLSKTYIHYLI